MSKRKRYWLVKSEPDDFSIDDLERVGTEPWTGVRNYQARNFMRDDMRVGDLVLFHHSNADPPGVAGVARVCKAAYPDHTALDKDEQHYDPKASADNPIWMMVDIEFVEAFTRIVSLAELRATKSLEGMLLLKRGQRLSVMPVEAAHFKTILKLAHTAPSAATTR